MERLNVAISCVLILFLATQTVNCIECYTCSSKDDQRCLDPLKNDINKQTCKQESLTQTRDLAAGIYSNFGSIFDVKGGSEIPMKCLKQVTKMGNKEYVLRGCQLAQTDPKLGICKKLEEERDVKIAYCSYCDSDLCNSSVALVPANVLLVFVTFVKIVHFSRY